MSHYILIKPNDEMQALLAQHPYMSMSSKLLFVEQEGRPILSIEHEIETQKLFFLAQLHDYMQMYKHSANLRGLMTEEEQQRNYLFFHTLLGDPPYTRQLFDRWWTIERIDLWSSYNNDLKKLPLNAFEVLEEPESRYIAGWLSRMRELKKRQHDQNTGSIDKEVSDD